MMRSPKSQTITLILVLGIVALVAQLAGVGGPRLNAPKRDRAGTTIATLADATVPDIGSTALASTRVKAAEGDALQLRSTATLTVRKLSTSGYAQIVCGIRYSRAGDPAWTLGTPSKTVVLRTVGARQRIAIDRSIAAPATDTYRSAVTCHVASPATGARVVAVGTMRIIKGLPAGAATPV